MGFYTKIDAQILIKPEHLPVVAAICDFKTNGGWADVAKKFPWLSEWSRYPRADFIPRGGPADYSLKDKLWVFQCSLKNYNYTIEKFCSSVLPTLAEEVILFKTQYEEQDGWTFWYIDVQTGLWSQVQK